MYAKRRIETFYPLLRFNIAALFLVLKEYSDAVEGSVLILYCLEVMF